MKNELVGNSSELGVRDSDSSQPLVGNPRRRAGRPRKSVDIAAVARRRSQGESIRSIADSLGVAHSTLLQHIERDEFERLWERN